MIAIMMKFAPPPPPPVYRRFGMSCRTAKKIAWRAYVVCRSARIGRCTRMKKCEIETIAENDECMDAEELQREREKEKRFAFDRL